MLFRSDKWAPIYAATYAAMVVLHAVVLVVMGFIKFPPPAQAARAEGPARPLWQIAAQRDYAVAAIAAMIAFGTMSFLMSAAPLAIVGCGLPHTEAHWVIFVHVMGMFVPSFFTGNLISRFGTTRVMAAGATALLIGVVTALLGITAWHFRISLMFNGIGWNFLFVEIGRAHV